MPTIITTPKAVEKSTFVVSIEMTDEDGSAVVPDTMTATLTDMDGTVINSLEDEVVTPATVMTVVYSGDDLSLAEGVGRLRLVTFEGTYTSSYGAGLPFNDTVQFEIVNAEVIS